MINNDIICKKQTHTAVKVNDNTELKDMKTSYTQINKVLKTDEFAEWKQVSNSEFTHFTL